MKLFKQTHTYKHDWDTVTSAFWVKYPNPLQPHVVRIDTLDRQVNETSYRALRLLSLDYSIPAWINSLLHRDSSGYGLEETFCDFAEKRLTLKSRNVTFSSLLTIEESCEYQPHPTNPQNWTLYTQSASYKMSGLGFLAAKLESAAVQSASEKAKKGLEAVENAIHRLESTNWRRTCSDAMQNLETKLKEKTDHLILRAERSIIEKAEQMEKSVTHVKERMESTVEQTIQGSKQKIHEVKSKVEDTVNDARHKLEQKVFRSENLKSECFESKNFKSDSFENEKADKNTSNANHKDQRSG